MPIAPEAVGRAFIRSVKSKDLPHFLLLISKLGYSWGPYFNSEEMTEEDKKWALRNRPDRVSTLQS